MRHDRLHNQRRSAQRLPLCAALSSTPRGYRTTSGNLKVAGLLVAGAHRWQIEQKQASACVQHPGGGLFRSFAPSCTCPRVWLQGGSRSLEIASSYLRHGADEAQIDSQQAWIIPMMNMACVAYLLLPAKCHQASPGQWFGLEAWLLCPAG